MEFATLFCKGFGQVTFVGLILLGFYSKSFGVEKNLHGLQRVHPRLLINEKTWTQLKTNRKSNKVLDDVLLKIEGDAEQILKEPVLVYKKEGKRLLSVSREALRRILDLSFAFKIKDDLRFKVRLEGELLSLAAFPDWNPSHFLDVAEMTTGFSLAYDWLYADWSGSTREILRKAILEKALKEGDVPHQPNTRWYDQEMNWNQVCLTGLAMGALAIADEAPDEAEKILTLVHDHISNGLKPYAPSGIYPEGPSYWAYGTTYQVLLHGSLQTALHSDWNLNSAEGFKETGKFLVQMTGPNENFFNYSDGKEDSAVEPALYWMAEKFKQPEILFAQNKRLEKELKNKSEKVGRFFPLLAIWGGHFNEVKENLPLIWQGEGKQALRVFRSSWTDPKATYLAVKAGSASLNHAHMDAGSFVFERDGVRWASDLGSQEYNSLESKGVDLWSRSQKSQRWDVFRIGSLSHNTLTLQNQRHQVEGFAKFTSNLISADGTGLEKKVGADQARQVEDQSKKAQFDLDLSEIFTGQAKKVSRSFLILSKRNLQIQDEIEGATIGSLIHWNWTTKANVSLHKNRATLSEGDSKLSLEILSPPGAQWKVKPADPLQDYDAPNPGASLLFIDVTVSSEKPVVIKVLAR